MEEYEVGAEDVTGLSVELIPGGDIEFVGYIKGQGDKAQLAHIEVKVYDSAYGGSGGGESGLVKKSFRWVVTKEDGTRVIVRPENPSKPSLTDL